MKLLGIHHITAITSDAQTNIDFYSKLLGLRLIKVTVNFDDPGSYHLYYGDSSGKPGSVLTFFAWPGAYRGGVGGSQVTLTSFAVAAGALTYWQKHLASAQVPVERIDGGLRFKDPDGMHLELLERSVIEEFSHWGKSSVPAEYGIRGFAGATLSTQHIERSSKFLSEDLGLTDKAVNTFGFEAADAFLKLEQVKAPTSQLGTGIVHHIAFRVADDAAQLAWLEKLGALDMHVSPVMDRSYFHSIYFREPSGVLFEFATDKPGFAIDEGVERLGTSLCIPPWMEANREAIVKRLPQISSAEGIKIPS